MTSSACSSVLALILPLTFSAIVDASASASTHLSGVTELSVNSTVLYRSGEWFEVNGLARWLYALPDRQHISGLLNAPVL